MCAGGGGRWCVGLVRVVRLYEALLLTKDGTWPLTAHIPHLSCVPEIIMIGDKV